GIVEILGGTSGFAMLRIVIGAILILAAGSKTYSLLTANSESFSSLPLPAWIIYTSVLVEWALGAWLLSGLFDRTPWICTVICFAVFLIMSLMMAISGAETCGCFGLLATSPTRILMM